MAKKHYMDIIVNKEKLSTGEPVYVAHCTGLGIASQGSSMEEAVKNLKEAITLYIEECPEKLDELEASEEPPTFSLIEVTHDGKIASAVR